MSNESQENELRVRALGSIFVIDTERFNSEDKARIRTIYSRCLAEPNLADDSAIRIVPKFDFELYQDVSLGQTGVDVVLAEIVTGITLSALEHTDTELFLVHSAVLEGANSGEAVAFVAPSGVGKTTLAATLGASFGYVSDETLAVNIMSGQIVSYQKPLSQIVAGAPTKKQVGPDELGLLKPSDSLRLGRVYYLDRRDDAPDEPHVAALPWQEAIELLVPQVSYLTRRKEPLKDLMTFIKWAGGIQKVAYNSSESLAYLLDSVGQNESGSGSGSESESAVGVEISNIELPKKLDMFTLVVPGHAIADRPQDALLVDGHLVVLALGQVVVLSDLASAIWFELFNGRSVHDLCELLIGDLGDETLGREIMIEKIHETLATLVALEMVVLGQPANQN
ncbi:MAG: hypothetical protein RL196_570 [Actinomycetota bacterium]|jgi:energy-coupling factor transporter ATP-binding protein EcfA2